MITRPSFPKKRNVMLINDTPVRNEIDNDEPFSSASNLGLLTALRRGKVDSYARVAPDYKGILSTDIYPTYLDYNTFDKENFDFKNDFKRKKDLQRMVINDREYLIEKDVSGFTEAVANSFEYIKVEHQKEVYISKRLWIEFQGLLEEIRKVEPKLVIITGKWILFLLTGIGTLASNQGTWKDRKPFGNLHKLRGSLEEIHPCWGIENNPIVFPIYHTINALTMQNRIFIMEMDLQKAAEIYHKVKAVGVEYYKKPPKRFYLGVTADEEGNLTLKKQLILFYLDRLLYRLETKPRHVSIDIETMFHSTIDCLAITDNINHAICIPFASANNPNLWSIEDEIDIQVKIREVLLHKNCLHIGQNYSYDCQFFYKLSKTIVAAKHDTMVLHHVLYGYLPKDLSFLASLYCEFYRQWKRESEATKETPAVRWEYNAKDVMYTLEVLEILLEVLSQCDQKLQDYYKFKQLEVSPILTDIMNDGVSINVKKKEELLLQFRDLLTHIEEMVNDLLGEQVNLKSSVQVKRIFTDLLQVAALKDKKRGTDTFGSDAMLVYREVYPLYRSFITLILEYRSIGVFVRTFLSAIVDDDNRMRTAYNVAGTVSERLSSRKNAFGTGANLQNLPSKGKLKLDYAYTELEEESTDITIPEDDEEEKSIIQLPNVKELFIPDNDEELFFDIDLAAADARVIAWTSECRFLTELFEDPAGDVYLVVAKEYYQNAELTKSSEERQVFKAVIHGSNYLGRANTLAAKAGLNPQVVQQVQDFYFHLCPEIVKFHERLEKEVRELGYLTNCWGSRAWFLDRKDPMLLNKAAAWVGSSPVSILINKALVNLVKREKEDYAAGLIKHKVKPKLQVHDSLAGVFRKEDTGAPNRIISACSIPLPFDTPRIIPVNIKIGETYGGCK